jgi:hypothetical protein
MMQQHPAAHAGPCLQARSAALTSTASRASAEVCIILLLVILRYVTSLGFVGSFAGVPASPLACGM